MKAVKILALLAVVSAISGCMFSVPSAHALYTPQDVVFEPAIVGVWVDIDPGMRTKWKFFKLGDNAYRLVCTDDKSAGAFDAHLVRLGDSLYMDTTASDASIPDSHKQPPSEDGGFSDYFNGMHMIPGHLFSRIRIKGDSLSVEGIDPDWFSKAIEDAKIEIDHEKVGEDLYLSATTPQLQEFVQKVPKDGWSEFAKLKRVKPRG